MSDDAVFRPKHYDRFVIEPATYVMANQLNFLQGNVIKYVSRYDMKNGIEDLKKAKRCIDMLIETEIRKQLVAHGVNAKDVWKETL